MAKILDNWEHNRALFQNVEKKPLNTGEIVWILVASIIVLGGIAYYLTFYRSDETPPAPLEESRPLTAEEKDLLLNDLKSPTNTKTDTIVAPQEQKILDELKATSSPKTTVNNSVLDSLKANK